MICPDCGSKLYSVYWKIGPFGKQKLKVIPELKWCPQCGKPHLVKL
jgi:RNA polymerase subunit RPABC4/transcription elongation factor Spt4